MYAYKIGKIVHVYGYIDFNTSIQCAGKKILTFDNIKAIGNVGIILQSILNGYALTGSVNSETGDLYIVNSDAYGNSTGYFYTNFSFPCR